MSYNVAGRKDLMSLCAYVKQMRECMKAKMRGHNCKTKNFD